MISPYASPTKYGWHSRSYTIGKELANRGHEVTVFAFLGNQYLRLLSKEQQGALANTTEIHEGVNFHWFQGFRAWPTHPVTRILNWKFYNQQFRKWLKEAPVEKPDTIVLSSPSLTPAFLLKEVKHRFPKARIVFEIRDIWPLSLQLLGNYSAKNPVMRWLARAEREAVVHSDAIIGLMPGVGQYFRQNFGDGVKGKEIAYIPHSVDFPIEEPQNVAPKQGEVPEYFIGYAGTIGKANDVQSLLSALKILNEQGIQPKTLIIGDGILRGTLATTIEGLHHVTYKSWMPRDLALEYLKHCAICYDGFLDIPLYDFGFSRLKWADYLLLKKPVLTSFGGNPYELPINDIGWRVAPESPKELAKTISHLYTEPLQQTILDKGNAGFRFLKAQRSTAVLINAYERAIFGQ